MKWAKLGLIIKPNARYKWLSTYAGVSFALARNGDKVISIYVTGRDQRNRSQIGLVRFSMDTLAIESIDEEPVLPLGEHGTFDENGVSYPWIVADDGRLFMYYVGWIPTVLVPFQNELGLAKSVDGTRFTRATKAPIFPKSDQEYLGTGSVCVLRQKEWKMWYTSFARWGSGPNEHKHYYTIKYAESDDGVTWRRPNIICIPYQNDSEYAIGRPSVLYHDNRYHMWYCYRGERYRIGYATSGDGTDWTRQDDLAGIDYSAEGWDSEMLCYPHCFVWNQDIYMLYNGNDYGKTGLGLAKLESW